MSQIQLTAEGVVFSGLPPSVRAIVSGGFETPVVEGRATLHGAAAGTRYAMLAESGHPLPDPRSRFQPEGVHGPSEIVDPQAYVWADEGWRPPPLRDLIIYELHVGTFTEEGTFRAAIAQLSELVALGVTAVELMPVSPAPGRWNWGYDGVSLFAVKEQYGRPDDLKALVDAAHAHGLSVLLDVVYNHFGPEGNYLAQFGPFFTDRHPTPWGPGLNFDGEGRELARQYVVDNAVQWLEEFRFDGLRLDAVQFMFDDSAVPITAEIAAAADAVTQRTGREKLVIGESNVYVPSLLRPRGNDGRQDRVQTPADATGEESGSGFDGLWADDFLYAVHTLLTGEQRIDRPFEGATDVAESLRRGALYEGVPGGRRRVEGPRLDLSRLVWSIQNHDLVGNDPHGRRMTELAGPQAHRAAAALLLLYPAVPLLFMGEEFAAATPFHFFTDFGDTHLREAVKEGRRRECEHLDWSGIVCPTSEDAFTRSLLGPQSAGDAAMLNWYETLIGVRKRWQSAGLLTGDAMTVGHDAADHTYHLSYAVGGRRAGLIVRLTPQGQTSPTLPVETPGTPVLSSVPPTGQVFEMGRHDAVVWEADA